MPAQPEPHLPPAAESAEPLLQVVPDPVERMPWWMAPVSLLVNAAQLVFLGVWSALCITLAFVAGLLTFRRELPLAMARRMWAPPLILMTGSRLVVEPLPDVDWSKPHIYAMNHQSMADIACAFWGLPANLRFVAKHTLKYVPFIGWYMWFTGMVFINRSDRSQALSSLQKAGERIREGANILAYPEGTRSVDGSILPFKKGPFVLAIESQVPIIPVAIEGTRILNAKGTMRLRPALVRMKVGEPIPTKGLTAQDRDALLLRTRDAIIRLHREIGGRGGDAEGIAAAGVEGRSARQDA